MTESSCKFQVKSMKHDYQLHNNLCFLICTKILIKNSMLVCKQIETHVSSQTRQRSRESGARKKKNKTHCMLISLEHMCVCTMRQRARRLMFIDITIIFVKQCITNWKSLDIFA